jgi:hypothetical protein
LATFTLDLAAVTSIASASIPCTGSSRAIVANNVAPKNIAKAEIVNRDNFLAVVWKLKLTLPEYNRCRREAAGRIMRDKLSSKATLANVANKRPLWRV